MQRENRRLAAIVAADIAGYSLLIGRDEEGTLRTLRAHRQELIDRLIDEHGGRIANTAGDSLLFEFPSTVDAMRSALAVQEGMAERNRDFEADRQTGRLRRHRRPLRPMHRHSPIIRNLVDRVADIYTPAPIRYSSS